jgi:hypothetical protein
MQRHFAKNLCPSFFPVFSSSRHFEKAGERNMTFGFRSARLNRAKTSGRASQHKSLQQTEEEPQGE